MEELEPFFLCICLSWRFLLRTVTPETKSAGRTCCWAEVQCLTGWCAFYEEAQTEAVAPTLYSWFNGTGNIINAMRQLYIKPYIWGQQCLCGAGGSGSPGWQAAGWAVVNLKERLLESGSWTKRPPLFGAKPPGGCWVKMRLLTTP